MEVVENMKCEIKILELLHCVECGWYEAINTNIKHNLNISPMFSYRLTVETDLSEQQ